MNCPYCEVSSLTTDGLEQVACCQKCRGDWMTGRGPKSACEIIYLPFAKHLSEEDKEPQKKAA